MCSLRPCGQMALRTPYHHQRQQDCGVLGARGCLYPQRKYVKLLQITSPKNDGINGVIMPLKLSTPIRDSGSVGNEVKSNQKILIVYNESLVVEELVEFLPGQAFYIIDAVGANVAHIQFTDHPAVVLVVSDFRMPKKNCTQLQEAINYITDNDD